MKTRDLVIDADHILHAIAGAPAKNSLDGEVLEMAPNMKVLKKKFNAMVKDIEDMVAVQTVSKKFTLGKTVLVFSDPKGNFRFDLYPDYKGHRKRNERTQAFYKLRDWAIRRFIMVEGVEADDVVAYYVRNGAVGVSTDKDLLKGVPGRWFDSYHSRQTYEKVKKKSAKHFTLLQTLAGDPTDKIPGIPRVGMKTAEKILVDYGNNWDGVVQAYIESGLTEADAVLNRRLIGMDQWSPLGIELFCRG